MPSLPAFSCAVGGLCQIPSLRRSWCCLPSWPPICLPPVRPHLPRCSLCPGLLDGTSPRLSYYCGLNLSCPQYPFLVTSARLWGGGEESVVFGENSHKPEASFLLESLKRLSVVKSPNSHSWSLEEAGCRTPHQVALYRVVTLAKTMIAFCSKQLLFKVAGLSCHPLSNHFNQTHPLYQSTATHLHVHTCPCLWSAQE